MLHRVLVYKCDYDVPAYGRMDGFIWPHGPKDWFPVNEGRLLAHDILEHFAHDDGSVEGELMALGASVNIRGISGLIQASGYASDLEDLIRRNISVPHQTTRLSEEKAEQIITDACTHPGLISWLKDDDIDVPEMLNRCHGWMRIGYRRSVKRFGDDHANLTYMFQSLHHNFDAERRIRQSYEGQKCHISVDTKRYTANVEIRDVWDR